MSEDDRKMILVPAADTKPATPGSAGTSADGEWVWLASSADWDVGPYQVVTDDDGEAAERLRQLITQWRTAAEALKSTNAAWSSHFYDCANELERLLTP